MKNQILIILLLLLTGCASVQSPIGNPVENNIDQISSDTKLYAQLYQKGNKWTFQNICASPNRFSGYPECQFFNDPWKSYVSLDTLKPTFPIDGYICTTIGLSAHHIGKSRIQGKRVPRCQPSEYWESDMVWGEFGQWLFIIPILTLSYYEEIYFNHDAFNSAAEEANKTLNRKELSLELNKNISENKKKHDFKIAQEKAKKIKEEQRLNSKLNKRKALFSLNLNNKKIGSEICSIDHRIGYVEEIAGTRIKINVKGQAFTESRTKAMQGYEFVSKETPPDYFLFQSDEQSFKVNSLNTIIWDDFNKWATCDISGY